MPCAQWIPSSNHSSCQTAPSTRPSYLFQVRSFFSHPTKSGVVVASHCSVLYSPMVSVDPALISANSPFVNLSNYTNWSIPSISYLSFYSMSVLFTIDSAHATLGSYYVNTPAFQHFIIFQEQKIVICPFNLT